MSSKMQSRGRTPKSGRATQTLQANDAFLTRLSRAQQQLAAGLHSDVVALLAPVLGDPRYRAVASNLLSIAAIMAGDAGAALSHARAAVAGDPNDARFLFTLGRASKVASDLDGAEAAYRRALILQPDFAEVIVSLGIVRKVRGDVDDAIACYDRAIALRPGLAVAHANRSNALALKAVLAAEQSLDDPPSDEVLQAQSRAVALDPGNALLQRNYGVLLIKARRRREAVDALNLALAGRRDDVECCVTLGFCLRAMGQVPAARELYERWLGENAPNPLVMRALAALLTRDGHIDLALTWAEKAAAIDSDPHGLLQLGSTFMQARRLEESLACCRRAIDQSGGRPAFYPTYLLGTNYLHEDPQPILDAHAEFGRRLMPLQSLRPACTPLRPGERLRVGYVSGDFFRHSVTYFVSSLLEHRDESRFEVTCYSNLGWGDAVTDRLKSYGSQWVDCDGMSDAQLQQRIRDDGIHVLIDLSGHTSSSRVFVFALGTAPVQMSYLGYPTVTGVPSIDFRITDSTIDPGDMPTLEAELPLCLGRSMFCYRPDEWPLIGPVPAIAAGRVTFGSFNNIAKVTDRTLDLWARVMSAVPGSHLLLKSPAMAQEVNRRNIEAFMGARGITSDRLNLRPWISSKSSHLEMYNEVDIALDPFPYNGATTTCEALWMGVPVVSLRGRTHTSRMGASILAAAGQADWITGSEEAYVGCIAALAADAGALTQWRANAREQLAKSELFDEHGFVRAFEDAVLQGWRLMAQRQATRETLLPRASAGVAV